MLHGCTVEDLCLIGMGSVILDGAIIRSRYCWGRLAGAGRKRPGGGFLWLGRPAKKVRS